MTVRAISSLQNDTVKLVRSLELRKARKETGLFVAEGASLIESANVAGLAPKMLIVDASTPLTPNARAIFERAVKQGAEVLEVTAAVMGKLAQRDNPQTLIGVFEQRFATLPEPAHLRKDAIWLALETVRDPGNLGTILRTLDAVEAAGVILVGQCCDPYSREAVRASMGSVFAVPPSLAAPEDFVALARAWPGDVVATDLKGSEDFRSASYRGPVLLMMGSEGPGLSAGLLDLATRRVKIPMAGRLDSLNLAIATALVLYQIAGPRLRI